jgi:membrane protein required for colicin V production
MNALDFAVIGVIGLSAIFAFARGLVREALSIVAWVGAALITLYGFSAFLALTSRFIAAPLLAELVTGAGLFLVSLIVLTILTGSIARFVHSSALSPIDRTLGLVFGVVRGAILVCLAYLLLDVSLPRNDRPPWINQAKTEPFMAQGADMLRAMLPESLQIKGAAAIENAGRAVDQAKDAQRAMRALSSPAAPAPSKPGQDQAPSYKQGDRRDLDRLIENAR